MEFLLHGHEINLKGGNRGFFSSKLHAAVEVLLAGLPVRVRMAGLGLRVSCADADASEVRRRLGFALGVQTITAGFRLPMEMEPIAAEALRTIAGQSGESFGLQVKRPDKDAALSSYELASFCGRYIQERLPLHVDLKRPDRVCALVIQRDGVLVSRAPEAGPGGMPAATAGRLLALISSGYDSPLAAYRLMRRGAKVAMLHFYAAPLPGRASSQQIVEQLARHLTRYQLHTAAYFCHFEPLQRQIVAAVPSPFRVLIYRRMMLRIAEAVARRHKAHGLITGDSLAQVASQTVRNLEAVSRVATLPIYRPLIGDDKVTIQNQTREIGTYDLSSENPADCCSAFLPPHPALASSPEELDAAETRLDIPALVAQALAAIDLRRYHWSRGRVVEGIDHAAAGRSGG